MPTVGSLVGVEGSSAGQAASDRSTAMWPLFTAAATIAPGPRAIERRPVGVTRLSFSLLVVPSFDLQVLTARTPALPARPAIQPPTACADVSRPKIYPCLIIL